MKKLLLFIIAVMAFTGMSLAQDIYSAGYFTNSNNQRAAAVYKNNQLLYSQAFGTGPNESTSVVVNPTNDDVYWVRNSEYGESSYGDIMKNGSVFLNSPTSQAPSAINNLYWISRHTNDAPENSLYAAGYCKVGGIKKAAIWKGSNTTPIWVPTYASNNESEANDVWVENTVNPTATTVYSCGHEKISGLPKARVWKNDQELFVLSNNQSNAFGIAYYNGDVYTVGHERSGSNWVVKVWRNDQVEYTLTSASSNGRGWKIYVEGGDVFVSGCVDSYARVWKNGTQIFSFQSNNVDNFKGLDVTPDGVYTAGYVVSGGDFVGRIYKDGYPEVTFTHDQCEFLYDVYVSRECTNDEVRLLPFNENFEMGTTDWSCWTITDEGNNTSSAPYQPGEFSTYWLRHGDAIYGDYYACHRSHSTLNQEGWLISPRLFLQPNRLLTKLTFKSNEDDGWNSTPFYGAVMISTTNTNPSSFSELVVMDHQNSWRTKEVDLSAYQGQAVYIAFKYSSVGANSTSSIWSLDDISVTESWGPCGPTGTIPYIENFDVEESMRCYYVLDNDHSGDGKHWKYDANNHYIVHPFGPTGAPQEGWIFNNGVVIPSGMDIVLTFNSKSAQPNQGTGKRNSVWIALDETGVPDPNHYDMVWEQTNMSAEWTEVNIPLTDYAGHTVRVGFKYEGNHGHNWCIDDVVFHQAVVEYTITANANNNNWGTVTGGGQYNAGAPCTLTATPNSGYQFQSWKKNGTVVSTNATYTFTVVENATYTAYFGEIPINYYTISTTVNPTGAGTVTGGGTFQEGSSITLTATANSGYTFDHWQDGNTDNPRTITVTQNATYTAYFTQDEYTINVYASPSNGGSVTGGGTYHYGETITLTATPNSGFEFAGWDDGISTNPRTITVTGNANYTAIFNEVGATYYTVNTSVSPAGAGSVTGGGTFEEGTVIVLEAVANMGYTFSHWNDGNTSNPRTVTVTGNISFTAYFNQNSYTITVVANPSNAGLVTGGGSYHYGDYAMLYATAYSGYDFVGWSDGSSENPHQVLVTGNATYTATFSQAGANYYNVSTYVSPANAGNVTGAGTYPEGTNVTLSATANEGYTFSHWNDGITTNPRTITVNNNMSFTAFFNTSEYTISVNANPSAGGTVTGGGTYPYGATVILTATPSSSYSFMQWGDGNVSNPRTITVTGNATYTALFLNAGGEVFTLTVTSNNLFLGSTYGSGTYPAGSAVEIRAYPSLQGRFVRWDDGNTENPRTVIVDRDMEIMAEFVISQDFTITVESADPTMGQAFGGGTFQEGSTIEIAALANSGYLFIGWQDGNADNPRTVTVEGDATYTAYFSENIVITYSLTLICNTSEGTVSGGGVYVEGSTATIQAFPNEGYAFDKWSDENTDNPRTLVMDGNKTLAAFFKGTGVDENGQANMAVFPNPTKHSIRIEGIEANSELRIFNVLGELVRVVNAGPDDDIAVGDLAPGLYLIRIGNASMRFVKE